MRRLTRVAAHIGLMIWFVGAASGQAMQTRPALEPKTDGPARHDTAFREVPADSAELSPDGVMLAHVTSDDRGRVLAEKLGSRTGGFSLDRLARHSLVLRGAPFQWDTSGHVLWVGLQDTLERGGWSAAPIRLVRLSASGVEELPALDPGEGRLDAVRWIRDQIALVQLDTRGQYYRPELPDTNPALGIMNARTGELRARLDYSSLATLGESGFGIRIEGGAAAATILPNGKARAILETDDWILWTEGEQPSVIKKPYPPSGNLHKGMYAMAPDGNSFLVSALLQADGMFCEVWNDNPCPQPRPSEGVWAALHDAVSGKTIWEIKAVVRQMGADYRAPEISPDGRFALITLPADRTEPNLALVSMADGSILQKFKGAQNFGFIKNGKALWVDGEALWVAGRALALYTLED